MTVRHVEPSDIDTAKRLICEVNSRKELLEALSKLSTRQFVVTVSVLLQAAQIRELSREDTYGAYGDMLMQFSTATTSTTDESVRVYRRRLLVQMSADLRLHEVTKRGVRSTSFRVQVQIAALLEDDGVREKAAQLAQHVLRWREAQDRIKRKWRIALSHLQPEDVEGLVADLLAASNTVD